MFIICTALIWVLSIVGLPVCFIISAICKKSRPKVAMRFDTAGVCCLGICATTGAIIAIALAGLNN